MRINPKRPIKAYRFLGDVPNKNRTFTPTVSELDENTGVLIVSEWAYDADGEFMITSNNDITTGRRPRSNDS